MKHLPVVSAHLMGIGFVPDKESSTGTLEVVWRDDTVIHQYRGVPVSVYADLMHSERQTGFVREQIEPKFTRKILPLEN